MNGHAMKPVILVCGKTGVGKTSLIQAMTSEAIVPNKAIGEGMPVTKGFTTYDSPIATFIDAEGMEPGKQTVDAYQRFLREELVNRLASDSVGGIITHVWYCVDGIGARFQKSDHEMVDSFGDKVILVVTKAEGMRRKQMEDMEKASSGILPDERIVYVSKDTKTGLARLVEVTKKQVLRVSPAAEKIAFERSWQDYYADRVRRWLQKCDEAADSFIRWGTGRSLAIAIPCAIPLSDMIPLSLNEAYMVMRVGSAYGERVEKNVVGMLTGVATGSFLGKFAVTLMPLGAKSLVAASVTYGIGKAAKAFFRSGKKLSKSELRDEYLKAKKEGKSIEWKKIEEEA